MWRFLGFFFCVFVCLNNLFLFYLSQMFGKNASNKSPHLIDMTFWLLLRHEPTVQLVLWMKIELSFMWNVALSYSTMCDAVAADKIDDDDGAKEQLHNSSFQLTTWIYEKKNAS